jgi:type III pantothenate kinase
MKQVLVIDVGNTSTSYGLCRAGRVLRIGRFDTSRTTASYIRRVLRGYDTSVSVIASVAPHVNPLWEAAIRGRILWVDHRTRTGVSVTYPQPETIGADRLANACGGFHKYGAPLIVADFGTAVTFDVMTARHGYVGGVIAPGLPLMFTYLAEKTAKLPLIEPGPVRHRMGRSTSEAMRLGARWGYRGMVREILAELMKNPDLKRAKLVATGGYAQWVVRGLKPRMIVDQHLTLYGLGRISELNG